MFLRCQGEAIWYGSVFSAYVYLIHPQNPAVVGYLSALESLTQFFAALLAGWIADRSRRDRLLHVACGVGIAASFLTFLSSWNESRELFSLVLKLEKYHARPFRQNSKNLSWGLYACKLSNLRSQSSWLIGVGQVKQLVVCVRSRTEKYCRQSSLRNSQGRARGGSVMRKQPIY